MKLSIQLPVLLVFLTSLKNFVIGYDSTLVLLNILYRHGDRSPVTIFKTDPNTAETWPQGLGYLTENGIKQHYELGKYLRQRYDGFLNSSYIFSEIYVNSSGIDRCLMSAYANLAGMYPPSGEQVWNENITWQPIPVHMTPEPHDNMLSLGKACPKYSELYAKSLTSPEVRQEETENRAFYDFISEKTGHPKETIDKVWAIADALYCEKMNNKTWASWVNETIYAKLRRLENWGFDLLFKGPVESRLKGGPILKQMIENMKMKAANQTQYKAFIYGGHDTTIAALMSAMQVFNQISPPYTSTVMMELHRESGNKYFVDMYYKNDTYPAPVSIHRVTLPGCDEHCPLEKFIELTKDRVPGDWDEECRTATSSGTLLGFSNVAVIIMSILVGMVILLSLVILIFHCKNRNRSLKEYSLIQNK